ncbi:MAG TPA: DUF3267 domain-containing protein [Hyphomicrobiaceae bacterium]|nr:DUF3267 domain-containing protein [Hyphomicrobiaceae bacterium]
MTDPSAAPGPDPTTPAPNVIVPPGWERAHDCSVSFAMANLAGLLGILPITALLGWVFSVVWTFDRLVLGAALGPLTFLAVFLVGIIAHELLHGVTWTLLARQPRRVVRYGFKWTTLSPYANALVPLPARDYRIGIMMPGVVLGLLPAFVAIATGHGALMSVAILMTIAAGGDLLVLWLLRGKAAQSLVLDHPSRVGCLVLDVPSDPSTART